MSSPELFWTPTCCACAARLVPLPCHGHIDPWGHKNSNFRHGVNSLVEQVLLGGKAVFI